MVNLLIKNSKEGESLDNAKSIAKRPDSPQCPSGDF